MSSADVLLKIDTHYCKSWLEEMFNFVFPISAFMVSTSRWGSDGASGDEGCLEKVIDS